MNICELDWKALNLTFAILDTRSPCDEGEYRPVNTVLFVKLQCVLVVRETLR